MLFHTGWHHSISHIGGAILDLVLSSSVRGHTLLLLLLLLLLLHDYSPWGFSGPVQLNGIGRMHVKAPMAATIGHE